MHETRIINYTGTFTSSNESSFQSLTTCNCLAQNVTYECTVSGGAFTVWSGSAFMCQGGEIPLRHVGFLEAGGECNNGAVIGRGIEIINNCYTSQLSVLLSPELIGRTITCSVDDGLSSSLVEVGTSNLTISTSKFLEWICIHLGYNKYMSVACLHLNIIKCKEFLLSSIYPKFQI